MALANKTSLHEIQLLKTNDWDQSVRSEHLQNIHSLLKFGNPSQCDVSLSKVTCHRTLTA